MVSEIEKIMKLLFGIKEKNSYLCRKNMTKRGEVKNKNEEL